jgi:hypothetical protein
MSDLRDELADLMMRAVHTSYELTPTSPWIKVTEAIEALISEALARHLREKHSGFDESLLAEVERRFRAARGSEKSPKVPESA